MRTANLWIASLLWAGILGTAQAQCPAFEQFKQAYEQGNLDDALIRMKEVEECMKSKSRNLSTQDQIEFYKYKTFLYQDLDQSSLADENIQLFMRKMLRKNPDYSPKQNLPEKRKPDFNELYNRHRYWPTHYLGAKAGVNFTNIATIRDFSVDQVDGGNRSDYSSVLNLRAAFLLELPIIRRNTRFYFAPELAISQNAYQFEDLLLNFARITFKETQSWVQTSLLFKYYFQRDDRQNKPVTNKFQPFVAGGFSLDFLVQSSASVTRQDSLPDGIARQILREDNLSLNEQRKRFNYSAVVGAGVKFKNFFRTGWDMFLEGRFQYGLPNLVKTENRGANEDLLYNFGYIDSDFRMHSFVISLGVLLPKYNPKPVGISGKPVTIDFGAPSSPKKKKP